MTATDNPIRAEIKPARLTRWTDLAALVVVALFFISGALTLDRYGVSWDEGMGNLFFGERYLRYYLDPNPAYLDFTVELPYHAEQPLNLFRSATYRAHPEEFPALADTLSAASMALFSDTLGWMGPIEAFHLFSIILSAVFLWAMYRYTARQLGAITGLVAVTLLAVYPRLWGDMHFNPKDVPEMVFFGLAVFAYSGWHRWPSIQRALVAGVLAGCALAIKANALALPIVLILGLWQWPHPIRQWREQRRLIGHTALMIASALLVVFASWPLVFNHPSYLLKYYQYIFSQGGRTGEAAWMPLQPLGMALATMPEVFLVGFVAGVTFALAAIIRRQPGSQVYRLLLAWLVVPIARISIPGAVNFDGIRHYLEFLPAAAILAAVGLTQGVAYLARGRRRAQLALASVLVVAFALNTVSIYQRYFPYLHVYFNSLVGGNPGAARIFGADEATDYWAVSYRAGIEWINANAEPGSGLHVALASWLVKTVQPIWLRGDLAVIDAEQISAYQAAGQPVYVMFVTRPGHYSDIARDAAGRLQPVHTLETAGYPLLVIYRYAPP